MEMVSGPEITDVIGMVVALPLVPVALSTIVPCALSLGAVLGWFVLV